MTKNFVCVCVCKTDPALNELLELQRQLERNW